MCRNAITVVVRPQGRLEGRASDEIEAVLVLLRQFPLAEVEVDLRSVPSLDEQSAEALREAVRTGRVCLTGMRSAARAQLSGRSLEQAHPGLRLAV